MKRICTPFVLLLFGFLQGMTQHLPLIPSLLPREPKEKSAVCLDAPAEWRMDSTWSSVWNSSASSWQRIERSFMTVNGCGMPTSRLTLFWNYALSEWVNAYRVTDSYHPDNLTQESGYVFEWSATDNAWKEENHAEYRSDGKILSSESKDYDPQTNSYTAGERRTFDYPAAGMTMLVEKLVPLTMQWENQSRTFTTFDAQGDKVAVRSETWNTVNQAWQNEFLTTATYNNQHQVLEEVYQTWNLLFGDWQNSMRLSTQYNGQGWMISQQLSFWNLFPPQWTNYKQVTLHYDERGNRIESTLQDWENSTSSWVNASRELCSYYPNDTAREMIRYTWLPTLSQYREVVRDNWDSLGNQTAHTSLSINMQTLEYYQGSRTLYSWEENRLQTTLHQQMEFPAMTWRDEARTTQTWDQNHNLTTELDEVFYVQLQAWKNSGKDEHFYSTYIGIGERSGLAGICTMKNPLRQGDRISCTRLGTLAPGRARFITMQGAVAGETSYASDLLLTVPATLTPGIYLLQLIGNNGHQATERILVTD